MRLTRLFAIAMVALAVSLAAPSARAATFDFATFGAGTLPPGTTSPQSPGEAGYSTFQMTVSGLTVTATASYTGTPPAFVYLDGLDGGRPAGMGVCHQTAGNCAGNSDDNVTSGETLRLTFSLGGSPIPVTLGLVTFRNADHYASYGGSDKFSLQIDGGGYSVFSFPSNGQWSPVSLTGTTFDFRYYNQEFYISTLNATPPTQIPEPTTLGLLGMGLLASGIRARRRRH